MDGGRLSDTVARIRLDVVTSQIDTALALARSADTLYFSGSTERATSIQSKAWRAYDDAVGGLENLSVEQKLQDKLAVKLNQVRSILDALPVVRLK